MTAKHYAMELEPPPQQRAGGSPSQRTFDGACELASASAAEHLARTATRLVRMVDTPLSRVRIQQGDTVVELEWPRAVAPAAAAASVEPPGAVQASPPDQRADGAATADTPDRRRFHITAPMVGNFYHAPDPGAAPFVQVGDLVERGQHIGIVEAMKLMNPIQAEQPGRVVEVLVGNGHPVEYDQPLVALEPVDSAELDGINGINGMSGMSGMSGMNGVDGVDGVDDTKAAASPYEV